MGGHQLAAMEDLHGLGRDSRIHFLPEQLERHRIEVLGDLDVVVEIDAAALPFSVFIRGRQRQQGWPVDLLKQLASGRAQPRSIRSLSWVVSSRIAAFSSPSEKNR